MGPHASLRVQGRVYRECDPEGAHSHWYAFVRNSFVHVSHA